MGRRRSREKKGAPVSRNRPAVWRGPIPPLAIAAATLFALACVCLQIWSPIPYPDGVARYWLLGGISVAIGAVLVAMLPLQWVRELPERCGALLRRPSPAAFAAIAGLTTICLSILFAVYVSGRASTTSDELAQLWHAKMLVHGWLALPADPNPEFFAIDNVIDTGRWYSQYPIGGPAVLAVGVLFGAPWLVNPVLAGVSAALLYHFARRAFGETEGRAIAALFSVTPMVLMMSGTGMNHVPVLCLATCVLAALVEWERTDSPRRMATFAALIGLALGAMATIRPLDAIVVSAVVGLFQLGVAWRDRAAARERVRKRVRKRVLALGIQAIAGAIGVAPLLYANAMTTGSPLRFGYDVLWGAGHQVGFHTDPHGSVHTLARAFEYAVKYVTSLNVMLMMWPVPALLVAIIGLIAMRRSTRWDALLLGLFWAQVVAYASYWFEGQFLGPRFLFTALPTIIVLLARTPFLIAGRDSGLWRRAAVVFTLACVIVSWSAPTAPLSVWGIAGGNRDIRSIFKVNYAGTIRAADVHHAVVFLREPFGNRLLHRLWGLGMTRGAASQLLATSDACSLLTALRVVEDDSSMSAVSKVDAVTRATARYAPGDSAIRATDPTVHISSPAAVTVPCRAELAYDTKLGGAPFGPALLLEPIGADGRIDGDVIYAFDLGERNALLRTRFPNRTWYHMSLARTSNGTLSASVVPY